VELVYSTLFPVERIYTKETEPFLMINIFGKRELSDKAYTEQAIRFANEKHVQLKIFADEKSIQLDFSFHTLRVEAGRKNLFLDILAESDQYCIRTEKGPVSALVISFFRNRVGVQE